MRRELGQQKRGTLAVITLDHGVEELFLGALKQYGETGGVALPPDLAERFQERLRGAVERATRQGYVPVLLVASPIRLVFKRYTEIFLTGLTVLAFGEVPTGIEVNALGMVSLDD